MKYPGALYPAADGCRTTRPGAALHGYYDKQGSRTCRKAGGVPQLMYNHSLAGYGSKYLAHFLDRRLMKSLSFHFHMSAAICAHFNRLFRIQPERNMVLHAITDRDVFRPSSPSASLRKALSIGEDDFVVSSIGRITEWKGQHVLIEAIHLGGVQLANCRILIAGPFDDGIGSRGYMDSLRALSKRYGLEKISSSWVTGMISKPSSISRR